MVHARGTILVVDDDPAVRDSVRRWLELDGFQVRVAADATSATHALAQDDFDLVLLDIRMPGVDGLTLQRRLHERFPELPVILVTAYGSIETAVDALKAGAFDYLCKPVDPERLSRVVAHAAEQHQRLREHHTGDPQQRIDEALLGSCPAIVAARQALRHACLSEVPVLIEGEVGVGRHTAARLIHENSHRRYFALVPLDCHELPQLPLEHLLRERTPPSAVGASAQPMVQRADLLTLAEGGTLLVDGIDSLRPRHQAQLLALIDRSRGPGRPDTLSDLRWIAIASPGLEGALASGAFSADLYYRIEVIHLTLPPLCQRGAADLAQIAAALLARIAARRGSPVRHLSDAALALLAQQRWPGNIYELANLLERAVVASAAETLGPASFLLDHPLPFTPASRAP